MYGLVVALHLLSLFTAPDVLSGLQGFAFWAIGLHYYHGLSGGGGGKLRSGFDGGGCGGGGSGAFAVPASWRRALWTLVYASLCAGAIWSHLQASPVQVELTEYG